MADGTDRHDGHDPALVASLFDGDLAEGDLATAQLRVTTCPSCAALHADLLALSEAMRAQATPARPRDFRLTEEDAARLRAEPVAADPRLTGVKTDRPGSAAHALHDTTLVASLADHSLPAAERAAGQELVSSCSECADLHADLVALVAATRAMPTPPRPIDYTLTRGHAARLRPNPWRRLVAVVGSAHDGVTRPLAIGLTALGLVGLMVSSVPSIGFGGAASSAASEAPPALEAAPAPGAGLSDTTGQTAPGAAAAPGAGDTSIAAPTGPDRVNGGTAPAFGITNDAPRPAASAAAAAAADGAGKGAAGDAAVSSPQGRDATAELTAPASAPSVSLLPLVSAALLVIGASLFMLGWVARRNGG